MTGGKLAAPGDPSSIADTVKKSAYIKNLSGSTLIDTDKKKLNKPAKEAALKIIRNDSVMQNDAIEKVSVSSDQGSSRKDSGEIGGYEEKSGGLRKRLSKIILNIFSPENGEVSVIKSLLNVHNKFFLLMWQPKSRFMKMNFHCPRL